MSPRPERPRSIHTADGGVVLDIDRGRVFSLNASGSVIFQLLEQGITDDQIVGELVKRFAIPAASARADVVDFRKSLETFSLLASGPHSSKE
jgi:hypothetical protein